MSEIRVGYSGLISLIVGFLGTFLGMIFLLIVTRTVSPLEFGTWGLISGLLLYAGVVEPIISVWVLREVARGTESGKTAIISGSSTGLGAHIAESLVNDDYNVIITYYENRSK